MKGYPHEFSGGMRQRVMIAMALITRPELLICDEPTTALDVTIQKQVLDLIKERQEKLGTAVILITHDLTVVKQACDHINVMYSGRLVESASTEQLFTNPLHAYTRALLKSNQDTSFKTALVASLLHKTTPIALRRLMRYRASFTSPIFRAGYCSACTTVIASATSEGTSNSLSFFFSGAPIFTHQVSTAFSASVTCGSSSGGIW